MAVERPVAGILVIQQGAQRLGPKPLAVKVAPRLGQTFRGALVGPEKEIVGVEDGTVHPCRQQGGHGGFAAAAPAVDGHHSPALLGQDVLDAGRKLVKTGGRRRKKRKFRCVLIHS